MTTPFLGEIKIFAFNFAPKGWVTCSGQLLAINTNQALFALLGTTYGGNGQTTFGLPDLRGRMPMHWGSYPGLTSRTIGERAGTETVTLLTSQLPAHNHSAQARTDANVASPGPAAVWGGGTDPLYAPPVAADRKAAAGGLLANTSLNPTGGSQAHPNLPPALVVNPCIALVGIFPSRN